MLLKHLVKVCFLLCLLAPILGGCDLLPSITVNGTPITKSNNTSANSSTLNRWVTLAPGVALRTEEWQTPAGDKDIATIVRFDPHHIKLSIGYQPAQPLLLSEWIQKEQATAIINGGYFDSQNNATALVVSNGRAFGSSYNGFGGMLSVDSQGDINLRSLNQHPYDPGEQLEQATQSDPMLVVPGGRRTQFNANASNSRRSVVAMDKQGRLLLIVLPGLAFSLDELADKLVASDLSIDEALNLDGGASTGLYVNAGNQHVAINSLAKLPLVIIVKAN
jgi:exopolysaccharide biosynthesis protein